ncbi:peptidylprolyl isomerase [Candidatus Bathyarchaeota archaeon]|nr:MAG: peptidylprolyl isomerase [Candidatus Bathyarchaeota archaeon]
MPSVQEIRALQRARKKARRRRMYLLGTVLLVAIIAVSVVVYAYIQPGGTNPGLQAIVYAKLNTSQGVIEIELYQNATPKTVTNFVNLANSGFYNNLVWHRIAKNFVIQTGNSNSRNGLNNSTWSQAGTGQAIPFEYDNSLHNAVGYVGMASTGTQVGGTTQFYININNNSATLDGKYAVFGKVIAGMDVAYAIGNLPIYNSPDGQPINPSDAMLTSVTISNSP